MITGPRILSAALLALWLGFVAWYGGSGDPMSPQEVDTYIREIRAKAGEQVNEEILHELRTLAASDDGNEFYMLNLIRYRDRALYPKGSPYEGISALEADEIYTRALVPYLLRHGGHPVWVGDPMGDFLQPEGADRWHRTAIVRYRSRRDLFNMVVDITGLDVGIHKWASIEKTHTFPVKKTFLLGSAPLAVGLFLAVLGLLLNFILIRLGLFRQRA